MIVKRPEEFPEDAHWGVLVFEPDFQYYACFSDDERNDLIAGLARNAQFVVFPAYGKIRVERRYKPVLYVENTPLPAASKKSPREEPERNLISDVRKRFLDANGFPMIEEDETQELPPVDPKRRLD
jgi:hypothetical protein